MKAIICILILLFTSIESYSIVRERFHVEVKGSSLSIRNTDVTVNCAAKFTASVEFSLNRIEIIQTDVSTQKMRCTCQVDLDIFLNQVNPGEYRLVIMREELKKYGYPKDSIYVVHSSDVKIRGTGSRLRSGITIEQSECKHLAGRGANKSLENEIVVLPNLTNSTITLNFELQRDGDVTIQLYNFLGKKVATHQRNALSAGYNTLILPTKDLPPGLYIGKLTTSNGRVSTFRLTWSK